jgi:diacylglycerol kinase family enzyme
VDDGILDVFVISHNPISMIAAAERFFQIPSFNACLYYWRGREITLESQPSKALWADGEEFGRTPVSVKVRPGALPVVVS